LIPTKEEFSNGNDDDDNDDNDDGNGNGCYTNCYASANLDYCDQFDDNNDGDDNYEFDIDDYLECENVLDDDQDDDGDDDSNSNNRLYVGAYCSNDGKSIYLGEFQDRQCTTGISSSTADADPNSDSSSSSSYYALF